MRDRVEIEVRVTLPNGSQYVYGEARSVLMFEFDMGSHTFEDMMRSLRERVRPILQTYGIIRNA